MKSLKKKIVEKSKDNPDYEIFFFDESRFGTHSNIGHGWFPTGVRTQVPVSLGFKNFYIYSAVSSCTGDNFHLMLPSVDTGCMNAFLQEFGLQFANKKIFLVVDGASWHKSSELVIPANINFIFLPAYSPELNPVERLWEYIKDNVLKNKVYNSIKLLEECVCDFIGKVTKDQIKSTCACSYLYT